ncbi:FecR family protein [Pedobacter hiemivivus]|uniref:FecR family protein n=1 Tax=Pedobacter hiemivivus TaxID=2530454 RepID=A0A4R0NJC2_9SPHI|nr:FecR family protein [Pedobacter hiemivivus]TCC99512.1 FecR family protein [Pedobacter hiemivivus]
MNEQSYLEERQLLDRYRNGLCSSQEELLIDHWFNQQSRSLSDDFVEPGYNELREEIWSKLPASNQPVKTLKLLTLKRITAAAAIFLFTVGVGFYFYINLGNKQDIVNASNYANDVGPGGNKVTITLANGKTVHLSDAKTGVVIGNDKLAYSDGTEIQDPALSQATSLPKGARELNIQTLTATTPRGGTYQVMLSDGTRIWMNADSKIQFPSKFSGKRRRIILTGEAYLEVAKDKSHPFVVKTGGQEIEVLGTHFNVSSYPNEPVKTTLLEGSVKVLTEMAFKIIRPGQQTIVEKNAIKVHDADLDEVIAWKDGDFNFNSESIVSIMTTLSRWYDIEVKYQGQLKDDAFTGKISRSKNISQVLKMLEKTKGVHFKIEGRRVTVTE